MSREENTKTICEAFAYYDRTGMQEFLEQKAEEGWLLVRKTFAGEWEFERTEPKKLRYAITYLPQFSNEDEFIVSDNKEEYLEICAASGWQFACAYKNMVFFYNEEENPLPLETDPEAELQLIHKSVLKSKLPVNITCLAICAAAVISLIFFDTTAKTFTLALCVMFMISLYIFLDFYAYLRWRKKALAAAATGEFSNTNISDKLVSGLFIGGTLLCYGVIFAELIATKDWNTLGRMIAVSVVMALNGFFVKLKKKTKSTRKKHIITFASVLIYIAVIAAVVVLTELL